MECAPLHDQPRRGIRFLLVPEMLGFAAYLAHNESLIPNMIAALNLDMVGEDQSLCGSTVTVEQAPGSFANYADDLVVRLVEETSSGATNYAVTPFSGGSDHCLLVDPSVGVPCPMINQWPDKFYHTSTDTLDKVDPAMLARAGSVATAYAYFLAHAGPEEAAWLAEEVLSRFKTSVLETLRDAVTHADEPQGPQRGSRTVARRVHFLLQRNERALGSVRRLADADAAPWQQQARRFAAHEVARMEKRISEPESDAPHDRWEQEAATLVPKRLCPGPIDLKNFINRMNDEEHETWWRVYKDSPDATYVYP
ncbi:MAG TPA: DUF4910 domain-containing protein, partial [Anaerolineae bacterium]|nr:DUF4910 domain-containing protein [Anaerolineae bacterium]